MLLAYIKLWKLFAEALDLGQIVDIDVRLVRMLHGVVLMIRLGLVETIERGDLRHDWRVKSLRLVQLLDVRLCDSLLIFVRIKNRRAILRAGIWALPIQFRRIVRDGEEHLEQLAVRNLRRVVSDFDRLGMSGLP